MDRRSFIQLGSSIGLALGIGGTRISNAILERVNHGQAPIPLGEFMELTPEPTQLTEQLVEVVTKPLAPLAARTSEVVQHRFPLVSWDWSRALDAFLDPATKVVNVGQPVHHVEIPEVMQYVGGEEINISTRPMEHLYVSFLIRDSELDDLTFDTMVNGFFEPALRTLGQFLKEQDEVYVCELPVHGVSFLSKGGKIPLRTSWVHDHQRDGYRVVIDLKVATRNPLAV